MKNGLKFFICLLIMVMVSVCTINFNMIKAEDIIDPSDDGTGYTSVLYDNTNGLPTSEANAIAQTEEGFLWIGSYSGLIRYDGKDFVRIDSTTGVASVVSLYVDTKNRLWIGTNDAGIALLEKGEFTKYGRNEGLKALSIREIVEDSNGIIYFATTRGIVYIGDDLILQQIDEPLINDVYIKSLKIGSDDILYGITNGGDIFTIRNNKLTGFYGADELGISDAFSIIPDENNPAYVYIGSKNSEVYYGKLDSSLIVERVVDVSPLKNINSINEINGKEWICADNGFGVVDGNTFRQIDNIPFKGPIEKLMVDYEGNLWLTSTKQGVMKIVGSRFLDVYEQYELDSAVINSTCPYEGLLFIGGNANGLTILNDEEVLSEFPIESCATASGEAIEQKDLIEMLKGIRIRSIVSDSRNNLWISTYSNYGLVRYKDGKVTCFTVGDGLPSARIRVAVEISDGSTLVACTGGVAVIKGDEIVEIYDKKSGIRNDEILTIEEAANGDILIGSDGDGIYIINKNDDIRHIGIEEGLTAEVVMRIKKDINENIYWYVNSNAIGYLDEDYNVHTIRNFPYSNNFDFYENKSGDMWILSSNGLYVAKVEELIANEEINPFYYNRSNGLSIITTANSYSGLDEEGNLYIAGTTGVNKVNIDSSFESVSNLRMNVPYVEADGVFIYPDEDGNFEIESDIQRLTIHSYVYNYSLINPQVTYYLDGFDQFETSVERSELTPVNYTNLRGGNYKFIMQISDPAGSDEQSISVNITKVKAFYEQTWFYVLSVIAIIGFIGFIVRAYILKKTKEFEEQNNYQKRLIHEISQAFAKTIDMKDKYTNGHSTRVAEYTAMLTRELGYDEDTVEKFYNIALLHDLGKIGIPEEVLNKPGKLTEQEFNIIKSHSTQGYNVLKDISIMPELADGAGFHHERPDGNGYPRGLKGDDIPRVAQIIAVADTFDAMYSDRPYRKRMNFNKVVEIMKEVSGTQLTPDVVDAFLRLVEKGEFKAPDDDGGGSTEDIDNIHKGYDEQK